MLQQSIASESFSPHSKVAAEALLAATDQSNRRVSASDQAALIADAQALARDYRRSSLRMPTASPSAPVRRPSIGMTSIWKWAKRTIDCRDSATRKGLQTCGIAIQA